MPKVSKRINKMAQIMCDCCDDNGKCWDNHLCTNINIQDCRYKENAEQLIKAGYIHISDSKNIVKQAKIDILNELKDKMFEREYMGVKYKERIFYESEIDDMIAEVQDGKDKG